MFTLSLVVFLLDADFPICNAGNGQQYPAVVHAHDQYYVFWIDCRYTPDWSIFGARVTEQGNVIDPNGRELYTDSASYCCDAATDGTNFLVVTRNHC